MKKFLKVSIIILLLIGAFCLYILIFASNLKYSEEIVINQNINTVIDLFDNPYNMKEYMEGIESYKVLSGKIREVGTKAEIIVSIEDKKIIMIEEIITNNLPEEKKVTYTADGVYNIVINRFIKVSDNQTKVINDQEFQLEGFMKIMGFFMSGVFKKQSRIYLTDFKDFAENRAPCTELCQKACCLGCKATEGEKKCIVLEDGFMPCCTVDYNVDTEYEEGYEEGSHEGHDHDI